MKSFKILFVVTLIVFNACTKLNDNNEQKKLARVYDKYLYASDIDFLIGENVTPEDSAVIIANYINNWIKEQLLLEKAEEYLPDEKKDIKKQIENYRTSLLIFKYRQMLIDQKLDTIVKDEEIQKHYEENRENYVLHNNIVKVLYLKFSKESPDINDVKKWYKSDDDESKQKLDEYCYKYANKYDDFNDDWVKFSDLRKQIPLQISNAGNYLKYRKYIEVEDSIFYYFVRIKDYKLKGTVQPLEYSRLKIKSIILNKRRFKYFDDLENHIYNSALDRNDFIIY